MNVFDEISQMNVICILDAICTEKKDFRAQISKFQFQTSMITYSISRFLENKMMWEVYLVVT